MLRHSTVPLAICVFLLAACDTTDGVSAVPETPQQIEPPTSEPAIQLEITSPPTGERVATDSKSTARTLAMLPENREWTLLARSPNGRGGFIGLRLGDNGNGDADAFSYDEETGELKLLVKLDYERPIDADGDGKFELQMVAYEYPGSPVIPFALEVDDQQEVFEDFAVVRLTGETMFGGLGRNITSLGDIDNDGRPDLAVAAPGRHHRDAYASFPPADYHPAGELYFVSGKALSETTLLQFGEGISAGVWKLSGNDQDENLGYNMTLLGDLDGDGIDDVVVARDSGSLQVISGASLVKKMTIGTDETLPETEIGTINVQEDGLDHPRELGPRTFTALGDLDGDTLPELAFCATEYRYGSTVDNHIFVLSGEALQDVLETGDSRDIADFYDVQQAAYAVYTGNHSTCGPLTALGDVDNDARVDIAIPMPGPQAGDSGILVYSGANLLAMMEDGGRQQLSAIDRYFYNLKDPYVHVTDSAAKATEQDQMVTALGDVTGDAIDDFAFSWGRYHTANDGAFIVKGDRDLLAENGASLDLRALMRNGGAIQLAASPEGLAPNAYRVEPVHALRAPEDGAHETRIFVGAGESSSALFRSYSLSTSDLPAGGTALLDLPIAGLGTLDITRENGRQLSYVTSVGDLNLDGYGDLAIGYGIADEGGPQDSGTVILVSGAFLVERLDRGEALRPTRMIKVPEE